MKTLWFLIPAHGRLELSDVCYRMLAWTCETLAENGLLASAVVAADDENLELARGHGFGTIERDNSQLGRKWNDLYEASGREGVDYVVPLGSDDWIDPHAILNGVLPAPDTIRCFRLSAIVSPDGRRLSRLNVTYDGGDGVRIIPTRMLEPLGFRPAEEDRNRAIDTSTMNRLTAAYGYRPKLVYCDLHPLQVVDFKSETRQLNSYADCQRFRVGEESREPFWELAGVYPVEAMREMCELYERRREAVPA